MDNNKVRAVTDWPRSQNLKDLERLLEFASFYKRFIRNFSSIAVPLTLFKAKPRKLVLSETAKNAFSRLKKTFTTALILHHSGSEQPFVVDVDASKTKVGMVLSIPKCARSDSSPVNSHPPKRITTKVTASYWQSNSS